MQKQKQKSETQKFQLKSNPQSPESITNEQVKAHLEAKIIQEVERMAQGIQTSVYQVIEFGKELLLVKEAIAREADPTKEKVSSKDF